MTIEVVAPIVAIVIGTLIAAMLGMALNKLSSIQGQLRELNGKFYVHVTKPHIHEAGFAKVEEQIANLLNTVKIAHDRIDRVKQEG